MESGDTSLWVFGYGSLCWNPGFQYGKSVVGNINGFSRRFWQGNTTHRGVPGKPGRVATLVEAAQEESTYGVAFQLLGEAALEYLNNREVTLGGYATHITTFTPKDKLLDPFPVLLFVATPSNQHWLGSSPLQEIAEQVVFSTGNSGHNVEYVLKIAIWMRETLPEVSDSHLYTLEKLILDLVAKHGLDLKVLMGEAVQDTSPSSGDTGDEAVKPRKMSADFSSKVAQEKLRCVKL